MNNNNNFRNVLIQRGFRRGASGRWISPDKRSGVIVELRGKDAIVAWIGGRTLFEAGNADDENKFLVEVY